MSEAEQKAKEEQESQDPDASNENTEGEVAEKKGLPIKLILMIAGPILLIGIIVGVLYFTGIIGGGHEEDKKKEEVAALDTERIDNIVTLNVPSLMVNLKASKTYKKSAFLKLTVQLEVLPAEGQEKEAVQKIIDFNKPHLVDQFQVYLRGLTFDDFQGSDGLQRLREELLERAKNVLRPLKVTNLLFVEMLVQ